MATTQQTVVTTKPSPAATPDFDRFAAAHPWVGTKIGRPALLRGGYSQTFQAATAYGAFGAAPREVHGAIRDRYVQLGGADGWLGLPVTDETGTPDGKGRYNHFEHGSIYWHPAHGAFEVHGAIRDKWAALGYETGWLGYPTSDELQFADGRVSQFERGSIYWWADTGAIALGDVIVQYTGLHCFGETDVDGGSGDDEPVATLGISTPDGNKRIFNTQIYPSVNHGVSRFDVIELYRGKPHGLVISSLLVEHSGGGDVVAAARKLMDEALAKGGAALAAAAGNVPVVGPVLGPVASVAAPIIQKTMVEGVTTFLARTLGLEDRPLGTDVIELSAKHMVLLAMRPEGHAQFGPIPWRFETKVLERYGASYKLYFNIFPA